MKTIVKTITMACALAGVASAHAEMVVIVHPSNAATTMTADQLANIYLGKDTSLAPIDLAGSNAGRAHFYSKVLGKDEAQVKAIWARLIFTGKSQPPKEVSSSAEAVKQVAANEKG